MLVASVEGQLASFVKRPRQIRVDVFRLAQKCGSKVVMSIEPLFVANATEKLQGVHCTLKSFQVRVLREPEGTFEKHLGIIETPAHQEDNAQVGGGRDIG